jgi:hypothetical protein
MKTIGGNRKPRRAREERNGAFETFGAYGYCSIPDLNEIRLKAIGIGREISEWAAT